MRTSLHIREKQICQLLQSNILRHSNHSNPRHPRAQSLIGKDTNLGNLHFKIASLMGPYQKVVKSTSPPQGPIL